MGSLLGQQSLWILLIVMVWVLPWKCVAMWKAARLGKKWWFAALLVVNTFAIFEIIYIFFIAPKQARKVLTPDQ